ncbi:RNA-directed DNA polymerase, eukaryota [Tanacetum coccineum]
MIVMKWRSWKRNKRTLVIPNREMWNGGVEVVDGLKKINLKGMLHQKDMKSRMVEDPSLIKAEMVRHYKTLFSESGALHPIFCCDRAKKVFGRKDATNVEKDLSEEEILDAVRGCGGDKALGPDWFNFKYIRKFWDILEWDLIRAIRWFVEIMEISNDCNSLFVTIIPKATDPIGLGDFWPISLIRCNYKIIVKVLAERIKRVVGKVVGMCKMLLSKGAYDSLNGRFLSDMMKKTRFRNKWCSWIKSCIRSSTMLILVSGSPTKEFCLERRVRANEVELRNMARWMRCGIGEFPFTYLGLLIGENMRRVGAWNTVVEKFKNCLSDWKAKSISFGGSLTLVKSVSRFLERKGNNVSRSIPHGHGYNKCTRSVQASSVASKSAFSTSGRVLSIRRTRLTPASLEMCMCLKDHLDAKELIPLFVKEIGIDASSEGTLSPRGPQYDYLMSSEEAEDDY